jgi:hypothetical protein
MGNDSSKAQQATADDKESKEPQKKINIKRSDSSGSCSNDNVFVFESTISSDSLQVVSSGENNSAKREMRNNVASDLNIQDLDENFESAP